MKIGIQTWGSHGDVRPFVALAEGLQASGHEVTLVITCVDSDRYDRLRASAAFKVELVATPVIRDSLTLEKIGDSIVRERNAIRQTQFVIEKLLLPAESEMFDASDRLCDENDLVIGHYFLYTLGAAAERRGRPYVSVALAHGAMPSLVQPPSGVPDLGKYGNRLAWFLVRSVLNHSIKKYPDQLRARNGIKAAGDLIDSVWTSKDLTLLAVSPTICVRKPDWPPSYQVCGPLDARDFLTEGGVSDELSSFLSDGPQPVFMTFGSMMSGANEKETIRLLTTVAKGASVRAIIQAPNWSALGYVSSRQIHFVDSVPHSEVFPKCKMIVHHGGAGTSHAALRAGKPSVVVAHTAEQELWGRDLEKIGVACKTIERRKATAGRIAAAIARVARSEPLSGRARVLGASVAQEDGVQAALELINSRFSA